MSHLSDATTTASYKRPVNLTLSENLIADIKGCTSNLSATAVQLLIAFVVEQMQARSLGQDQATQAVKGWNALHNAQGSFADEHSTL